MARAEKCPYLLTHVVESPRPDLHQPARVPISECLVCVRIDGAARPATRDGAEDETKPAAADAADTAADMANPRDDNGAGTTDDPAGLFIACTAVPLPGAGLRYIIGPDGLVVSRADCTVLRLDAQCRPAYAIIAARLGLEATLPPPL